MLLQDVPTISVLVCSSLKDQESSLFFLPRKQHPWQEFRDITRAETKGWPDDLNTRHNEGKSKRTSFGMTRIRNKYREQAGEPVREQASAMERPDTASDYGKNSLYLPRLWRGIRTV
jgi:hypothetical protein